MNKSFILVKVESYLKQKKISIQFEMQFTTKTNFS